MTDIPICSMAFTWATLCTISDGPIHGTVYHVELHDQYGAPVPLTNIASHYGHDITSAYDADGVYYGDQSLYYADNVQFSLHAGCTDFESAFVATCRAYIE